MYQFIRPLFFRMDAEKAHDFTIAALAKVPQLMPRSSGGKPVQCMGLTFPNRLGLAAGLDKNGEAIAAFDRAGFGFIEVGTVTPRAQPGNEPPRLFRLPEHRAIINRMGFNNHGIDALTDRISKALPINALLGINLGKNKHTPNEEALKDYLIGIRKAYPFADYLAINISSPNTAGLRELQHGEYLRTLLAGIKAEQKKLHGEMRRYVPIVVKIAPDLTTAELFPMLDCIADSGMDGIIATNTTLDKSAVAQHVHGHEQGGLSGAPLTKQSTAFTAKVRRHLPNMPLIAAGGVMSAQDMHAKLDAGADLVQIYTGFIYRGPDLVKECLQALDK